VKIRDLRRTLIVDKPLQYRIISLSVASGLIICFVAIVGQFWLTRRMITALENVPPNMNPTLAVLTEINRVSILFVILTLCALFVTWFLALIFSNRIAGPIYNIVRVVDSYISGDKSIRVRIRKDDFFHPLGETVNKLLDHKNSE
jgi:sensor histidine kinase YesM